LLGKGSRNGNPYFRDVYETERARIIDAAIISDLCPTQRTGAIKINGRSGKLILHLDILEI
jgi:hypothetical protein